MDAQRLASLWVRPRPAVMGIVNVTPDSFSDGGEVCSVEEAVNRATQMVADGADIVDVGGESSRPGAAAVDETVERERVLPVVAGIVGKIPGAVVSVDTRRAGVAAAALDLGAIVVNDITAGSDPAMLATVAARGAAIVLMHMRGEPATMQRDTAYDDVVAEVHSFLSERAEAALAAGVSRDRVLLDPGIGFGKDVEGNLALLRALPDLAALGFPVVVGASRKAFIGRLTGAAVRERVAGSLAAIAGAAALARAVVRVHDVAATVQFLTVSAALRGVA